MVAYLFRSTDVSTTVGRDHIANQVLGNRYPCAVQFDFVIAAYFATLGRTTIRHAATRTEAVVSPERRVEVPMPSVVVDSMESLWSCILRRCA
jgi:hypothetical protein